MVCTVPIVDEVIVSKSLDRTKEAMSGESIIADKPSLGTRWLSPTLESDSKMFLGKFVFSPGYFDIAAHLFV